VTSQFDRTVASWRAITKLQADERIRAIGVCNFQPEHLDELVAQTGTVPALNQAELHPFFTNTAVRQADQHLGILTQAWSPIGGTITNRPDAGTHRNVSPLQHPVITEIAERHAKSPAQAVLRWHLEHGRSAIPETVRPARLAENIAVFDFTLTAAETAAIDALDTGVRAGANPDTMTPADLSSADAAVEAQ
jgi:diketogulonate reductase-like aldo/keto reductase